MHFPYPAPDPITQRPYSTLAPRIDVNALVAALERDPENVAIRVRLGSLLLAAGEPTGALEQFSEVLARDAGRPEALRGVADAAEALGQHLRARAYRRLYQLLSVNADGIRARHPKPAPAPGARPRPGFFDPEEVLGQSGHPSLSPEHDEEIAVPAALGVGPQALRF